MHNYTMDIGGETYISESYLIDTMVNVCLAEAWDQNYLPMYEKERMTIEVCIRVLTGEDDVSHERYQKFISAYVARRFDPMKKGV